MPTRSDESRWPSTNSAARGSCCKRRAISSRHALCSLLMRAELNGKKIGPHGEIGCGGVILSGALAVTVVVQLPPGHGWSQRVRVVPTLTVTVMLRDSPPAVRPRPVVSSVTSAPVVDDSVPPPLTDQVKVAPSAPVELACSVMRSPSVALDGVAVMSQVTVGHGGSVISKLTVQVVCPVVTQLLGQSTAGTVAVTV